MVNVVWFMIIELVELEVRIVSVGEWILVMELEVFNVLWDWVEVLGLVICESVWVLVEIDVVVVLVEWVNDIVVCCLDIEMGIVFMVEGGCYLVVE